MKQTVNIRKEDKKVKINFLYNPDLYDIMKKYNGWFFKKEKCWIFPDYQFDSIKKELEEKHYNINFISSQQTQVNDVFGNKDVVTVYGHCKICGVYGSLGKSQICLRCLLK